MVDNQVGVPQRYCTKTIVPFVINVAKKQKTTVGQSSLIEYFPSVPLILQHWGLLVMVSICLGTLTSLPRSTPHPPFLHMLFKSVCMLNVQKLSLNVENVNQSQKNHCPNFREYRFQPLSHFLWALILHTVCPFYDDDTLDAIEESN
jgi:hypothetical protein